MMPRAPRRTRAARYTAAPCSCRAASSTAGPAARRSRYVVPADDNRERATCTACGTIHYENPLNVVGTVPVWGDQVLLCRRNIEPRYGLWTLPAGFMELGETTAEGAVRETDRGGRRAHRAAGPVHGAERRAGRPGAPLLPRAAARHRLRRPAPRRIEARLFARGTRSPGSELAFRTVQRNAAAASSTTAGGVNSACIAPISADRTRTATAIAAAARPAGPRRRQRRQCAGARCGCART